MSKTPLEFPTEPVIEFSATRRDDGSFYCRGTNIPLLHIVIRDPLKKSTRDYASFVSICQEMLNRNNIPAGEAESVTPWERVEATGQGTLRFTAT